MKLVLENNKLMLRRKIDVPWEAYHYMGLDHLYLIPFWRIQDLVYKILGVHWIGEEKRYFDWYKKWRDPNYAMVWSELD